VSEKMDLIEEFSIIMKKQPTALTYLLKKNNL
jgi:hypothetical protein